MTRKIFTIITATIWISFSEFVRNEFLLKDYWTAHYEALGLIFPAEPVNGAIWGLWSLVFSIVIYFLAQKFSLWQTFLLSWILGFVMMWLVIGNLAVLPYHILPYAIPLSLLEAFIASLIIRKMTFRKNH
ncbi:MAG TPA: hypothetical protein PLU49_13800 [Saprospiraceae bacterium]|nr:hypothetical protein [Saprospiraceae bacterium]